MSKFDILALLSAFFGVILINNPFSNQNENDRKEYNYLLGTIFSLSGALCGSIA